MAANTPYNSIYKSFAQNKSTVLDGIVCCQHGAPCTLGVAKKEDRENDKTAEYVNLTEYPPTPQKKKNRLEEIVEGLKGKLRESENRQKENASRRSKKSKSKKKKTTKDNGKGREDRQTDKSEKIKKRVVEKESLYTSIYGADGRGTEGSRKKKKRADNSKMTSSKSERPARVQRKQSKSSVSKSERSQRNRNTVIQSLDVLKVTSGSANKGSTRANDTARSLYLGACSFAAAEEKVNKPCEFGLYHQVVSRPLLDDLEPELHLYIVYRTTQGSYRHYRIRQKPNTSTTALYVENGRSPTHFHPNLDHLVRFYKVNVKLNGDNYADSFAWWEDKSSQ